MQVKSFFIIEVYFGCSLKHVFVTFLHKKETECDNLSLLFTVERHRKEKINAGINRIGNLLPCSQALKQVRNKLVSFRFLF